MGTIINGLPTPFVVSYATPNRSLYQCERCSANAYSHAEYKDKLLWQVIVCPKCRSQAEFNAKGAITVTLRKKEEDRCLP